MRLLLLAPIALLLQGCLAKTAFDIVTLPVRAVSAGVDAVTTSQAEADQHRGRQIREEEQRRGREARERERAERRAHNRAAADDPPPADPSR